MGTNVRKNVDSVNAQNAKTKSIFINAIPHQYVMMVIRSNDKVMKPLFPDLKVVPYNSPWILLALVSKTNVDKNSTTWNQAMIT